MAHTMKKATTATTAKKARKAKTAPAGDGRMRKPFDERKFAEDWAEGRLRQRDLAERYGRSLSTVKKIVTLYGGDIAVSSVPNQGSRFTATLPIPSREEASS